MCRTLLWTTRLACGALVLPRSQFGDAVLVTIELDMK